MEQSRLIAKSVKLVVSLIFRWRLALIFISNWSLSDQQGGSGSNDFCTGHVTLYMLRRSSSKNLYGQVDCMMKTLWVNYQSVLTETVSSGQTIVRVFVSRSVPDSLLRERLKRDAGTGLGFWSQCIRSSRTNSLHEGYWTISYRGGHCWI